MYVVVVVVSSSELIEITSSVGAVVGGSGVRMESLAECVDGEKLLLLVSGVKEAKFEVVELLLSGNWEYGVRVQSDSVAVDDCDN